MTKGKVIRLEESVKNKKRIKMKKIEPLECKNMDYCFFFFFSESETKMESKVKGDRGEGNLTNCLGLLLIGFKTIDAVNLL